jgi:phosphoglycolate phosphatase-like HAD superfamily hydrolase
MPRCELAIFDLDGTLIQLQRAAFVDAVGRLCADFRYRITRQELHLLLSSENMFGFAEPDDRCWLELVFWDRYAPREQVWVPVPGAAGALRYLRTAGVRTAVATGRRCESGDVRAVLAVVGLAHLIDDVMSAGVAGRVDKATMMRQLCERASCVADAALAIGDTSADVRAARDARLGMVIAVCSGQIQRRVLDGSGPDLVLRSVAELPGWVPGLRGARSTQETAGIRRGTNHG